MGNIKDLKIVTKLLVLIYNKSDLSLTQVHRAALWILGEYCERTSDMQALMSAIRQVTLIALI